MSEFCTNMVGEAIPGRQVIDSVNMTHKIMRLREGKFLGTHVVSVDDLFALADHHRLLCLVSLVFRKLVFSDF